MEQTAQSLLLYLLYRRLDETARAELVSELANYVQEDTGVEMQSIVETARSILDHGAA